MTPPLLSILLTCFDLAIAVPTDLWGGQGYVPSGLRACLTEIDARPSPTIPGVEAGDFRIEITDARGGVRFRQDFVARSAGRYVRSMDDLAADGSVDPSAPMAEIDGKARTLRLGATEYTLLPQ